MKSSSQHRRFLDHKVICIPTYDRPDSICDFVYQTASELAAQNVVIILALGENWRGKAGLQQWLNSLTSIGRDGVTQVGLFQFIPLQRFGWLRSLNSSLNFWLLARIFEFKFGDRSKLLWIFHPGQSELVPFFNSWMVHFDCVDWHADVDVKRTRLVNSATTVTTLAKPVQSRIAKISGKKPPIVPQGFDIQGFKETKPLPPALKKKLQVLKKKPLIGFFGGINQRLDISLLEEVASESPGWQFLFVGSRGTDQNVSHDKTGEQRLDKLLQLPNVTHISTLHRSQLFELMQACDVLTIPYDLQWEFNVCCFPMKVMEYFYTGSRIVSTPIPSLLGYRPMILFADSAPKFKKAIQRALTKPYSLKQKQSAREIAEAQTWKKKLDSVDVYLNKMLRSS